jgi:GGDEF domain-containing protein
VRRARSIRPEDDRWRNCTVMTQAPAPGPWRSSFQEFQLLATESLRISRRYERPFAVARLSLANVDDLRSELGPLRMDLAFRIAVDAIVEALREADFVGADSATSVMIGFPETPADQVEMNVVERVRAVIRKTIAVPLELAAHRGRCGL